MSSHCLGTYLNTYLKPFKLSMGDSSENAKMWWLVSGGGLFRYFNSSSIYTVNPTRPSRIRPSYVWMIPYMHFVSAVDLVAGLWEWYYNAYFRLQVVVVDHSYAISIMVHLHLTHKHNEHNWIRYTPCGISVSKGVKLKIKIDCNFVQNGQVSSFWVQWDLLENFE